MKMAKKKHGKIGRKRPGARVFKKHKDQSSKKKSKPNSTIKQQKKTPARTDAGNFSPKPSKENQETASERKKRVSFASKLVEKKKRKLADSETANEDVAESSTSAKSTPLKPILKSPRSKSGLKSEKKKLKLQDSENGKKSKRSRLENGKSEENGENGETKKSKIPRESGGKTEILSRKQRKEQLMELKAKRKPYLDLAVKAKKLWEQLRK